MSRRIVLVLVGFICALAMAAGSAQAHDRKATVIVFTVENLSFGMPSACGGGFGATFEMASPAGGGLGDAVSCLVTFPSCEGAGCRDKVEAIFTLDVAGLGTLTAPVSLEEFWPRDTLILQHTDGPVVSGSGAFAGASGSIGCVGTIDVPSFIPRITCVVRVS